MRDLRHWFYGLFCGLVIFLSACSSASVHTLPFLITATPPSTATPLSLAHRAVAPGPQCDPTGAWTLYGDTKVDCLAHGAKVSIIAIHTVGTGSIMASTLAFGGFSPPLPTNYMVAVTVQAFSDATTCAGLSVGYLTGSMCKDGVYTVFRGSADRPTGQVAAASQYTLAMQVNATSTTFFIDGKAISTMSNSGASDYGSGIGLFLQNDRLCSAVFSDFQFNQTVS